MNAVKQYTVTLFVFLALLFGASTVFAQEEVDVSVDSEVAVTSDSTEAVTTTETTTGTDDEEKEDTDEGSEPPTRAERLQDRQDAASDRAAAVSDRAADREAAVQERKDAAENRAVERAANQEERRAELSARAQERITNLAANVSNRLDAAVERMQNIIDRISSRVEKLNERGVDTSEAESHLADAQDAVSAAIMQLGDIDAVVTAAVTAEDPRTAWQGAKAEYLEIKELIKSAHSSLRAAVTALKEAVADQAGERPLNDTADEAVDESTNTDQ